MPIKYTLKHLFSENLKGTIWKIVLDDAKKLLWIESRTENREVYFYAYDFTQNKFLVAEKVFNEAWLLSVSAAYNGITFFQHYENEFSPARKGILAYDVYQDNILWENFSYSLEYVTEQGVLAFNTKIQPKRLELLDHQTGLLLKNISAADAGLQIPISNDIAIPQSFWSDNIADAYQLLKINDLSFKSFYVKEDGLINQYIHAFYQDNLIFSDYLNTDIQKMAPDTFFVWQGKLVYLRNKSEIVSYLV